MCIRDRCTTFFDKMDTRVYIRSGNYYKVYMAVFDISCGRYMLDHVVCALCGT